MKGSRERRGRWAASQRGSERLLASIQSTLRKLHCVASDRDVFAMFSL